MWIAFCPFTWRRASPDKNGEPSGGSRRGLVTFTRGNGWYFFVVVITNSTHVPQLKLLFSPLKTVGNFKFPLLLAALDDKKIFQFFFRLSTCVEKFLINDYEIQKNYNSLKLRHSTRTEWIKFPSFIPPLSLHRLESTIRFMMKWINSLNNCLMMFLLLLSSE